MTNTQTTTRTNHYSRLLAALVALAVVASLLAVLAAKPAHASTTFTVNSTSDLGDPNPNDGQCVIPDFSGVDHCTLRAAIQNANGTPGADTIEFDIPAGQSTTITPGTFGSTPLPAITDTVTIDGYTQPGASPNTKAVGNDAALKIQLNGTSVGGVGLEIQDASNSVIKGLVVNRFAEGITVGGDSVANRIEGNFVGTDPTGTLDQGNTFDGVAIADGSSETVVGGSRSGQAQRH